MVNDALTEPVRYPPRWYLGFVVFMSCVAVVALAVGLVGLYRNDQNAANQAMCFQSFAARFSTVSKEVREATVKTDAVEGEADKAAAKRDAAFQEVLTFVLAQDDDEVQGLKLFTALTDANAVLVEKRQALVKARAKLAKVRADHPIPDPPDADSDNCELTD